MLYLNHVVAVVVAEEPIYKGHSIRATKSGRSCRSERNTVDGAICESANREIVYIYVEVNFTL